MSTILWLEPVGGCSGDMALAALLDLGVSKEKILEELRKLPIHGWTLESRRWEKMGIWGTQVEVVLEGGHDHDHGGHDHDHGHDHGHGHGHDHGHDHGGGHAHDHRSWRDIRRMIEDAGLTPGAKARALAIFERLAAAEAKVHGTTPDEVHFHEVGAVDSIVDVVGVAIALDLLAPSRIIAAPPPMGSGTIRSQHGPMPIPAPATLEVLVGREVRASGPGERTTPTGAAILAAMSEAGTPSSFIPERIGYGIGHRDFEDAANVLRATLGKDAGGGDRLLVLECNLDDASPEVIAHALRVCLEEGALDAWVAPVLMKKGRPGHLFGVLAPPGLRNHLAGIIARETPTLGLRIHEVERHVLERGFEEVDTPYGKVPIKIGREAGEVRNAAPEWEVCVALGREHGVPPRLVREQALARWLASRE